MALAAGDRIGGRYTLISKLGSGGMADVWLASDEMLGRRVALKFLHERFAQDEQFVERFRREAQSAAGLQHPNVVGVYDRGETDGRHWIAMEYVEGAMLKDLIERGLSVGEAVEIVRQILVGARFAHSRGIVHRDLKPQNVLVDAEGRARVTDFGIARAGASEITATGSVLGTAQYLSPEQAQGLEITQSSDIYSIGVILYEALTGRVPFDAETPVAVALKQISEQPRPPSEVKPGVPKALDGIVLRALAKDPQNRFPSADEFLRALAAAEADPHTDALGETSAYGALGAGALAGAAAGAALGAGEAEGATPTGEPGTGEAQLAEEADGKKRKWITRNRAIALGVIALAAAGVLAWALTRVDQVRVPSVLEEQLPTARGLLEQRGFDVAESPVPSCTPVNTITEQDPRAGTEADEGSEVTLTVSLGLAVNIPSVRGETQADAKERIERENLLVDSRTQGSRDIESGRVIRTEPPAGTEVDCDSGVVTLVVSSGPNLVTLPDVLGDTQQLAESRLERRGFIVDVDTRDDEAPEGTVIGQDPGPGSRLRRSARVTIIVSSGAPTITVPNVQGQPEDTAVSTLQSRGLNVSIETQETAREDRDGRVLDQAPAGGTDAIAGDTVTIFVGEFVEEPEIGEGTATTTPEEETEEAPR